MAISFKNMQNWFGNRGTEVKRHYFIDWGVDDGYLWYVLNPNVIAAQFMGCGDESDRSYEVIYWCKYKSMFWEIEDWATIELSPLWNWGTDKQLPFVGSFQKLHERTLRAKKGIK